MKILKNTIGLLVLISFCSGCSDAKKTQKEEADLPYKIIGYVAGGRLDANPQSVDAKKLTHINYAFADIRDGKVSEIAESDAKNLKYLNSLKADNSKLKILISVGGWTLSGGFSDAALTPESREIFANSCLDYLKRHQLDGIDLDWEYPGQVGAGNTFREEDKENFTTVLGLLREKLDSLGKKDKQHYLLTIATGANQAYIDHVEMDKIHAYLDFINIMTYDYHGAWDKQTSHHTNLFVSETDTTSYKRSSASAVEEHLQAGVPAEKLVLGVAFYGRGWKGVVNEANGLHQQALDGGFDITFDRISDSLNNPAYTRYWDHAARAPYLWNAESGIFITYDDEESLKAKSDFIIEKGMGGAMFWEYTADNKEQLLNALYESLMEQDK
ncbi:hypothetical protein GWK08_05290 [Leptobacterium flavescens]|uniref:chitinase n=1 Tax=Leptobacterium flavescens TaxID=472055 RepID=A0A6P0UHX3_9FLAO|nr:glycoside hydrolase family 18 protein [Leptobacterium flavescens]NER12844.1 hypothetical protein [Leptobacterium flavescens]